jgi:hypothetical protein
VDSDYLEGVAQFGGRVVEIVVARNVRAITVGRIAVGVAAWLAMELMSRWYERRRTAGGNAEVPPARA